MHRPKKIASDCCSWTTFHSIRVSSIRMCSEGPFDERFARCSSVVPVDKRCYHALYLSYSYTISLSLSLSLFLSLSLSLSRARALSLSRALALTRSFCIFLRKLSEGLQRKLRRPAFERRGPNLTAVKDLCLKSKAIIWP